jgi:hypothetical protein
MKFNTRNREALIEQLKEANKSLEISIKTFEKMESESSTQDQLWQLVEIESKKTFVKMIEKALIDNNPFGLETEFI